MTHNIKKSEVVLLYMDILLYIKYIKKSVYHTHCEQLLQYNAPAQVGVSFKRLQTSMLSVGLHTV